MCYRNFKRLKTSAVGGEEVCQRRGNSWSRLRRCYHHSHNEITGMTRIHNFYFRCDNIKEGMYPTTMLLPPPPPPLIDIQDNNADKTNCWPQSREEKEEEDKSNGSPRLRMLSPSSSLLPYSQWQGHIVLIQPHIHGCCHTGRTCLPREMTQETLTFSKSVVSYNKDPLYFVSS